ncbi:permease prefix domain 1-containing protein [Bacillus pseudomycoides]|uniref:VanZ family protein n=1 Tax=Bacillus pseudomycoides TaxID=64104 RepID=UPI001FB3894A|nr:permease prefix domain 1-containing protein [Bacillus pseudomycoides]
MKEFENYIECIVKKTNLDKSAREELALELLDHLISLKEEYVKQGMSIEQAKRMAIQHFGEPDSIGGELRKSLFPYERVIKWAAWAFFIPYLSLLVWYLCYGKSGGSHLWSLGVIEHFSRTHDVIWLLRSFFDITPFHTVHLYMTQPQIYTPNLWMLHTYGQSILFIPFGLLVPVLFYRIRTLKAAFSFFIKVTLFTSTLSVVALVSNFDIDEIIFRMMGALIGFVGWRVLRTLKLKKFPELSNTNYVK